VRDVAQRFLNDRDVEMFAAQVALCRDELRIALPHQREARAFALRRALLRLVDYLLVPDPDYDKERRDAKARADRIRAAAEDSELLAAGAGPSLPEK